MSLNHRQNLAEIACKYLNSQAESNTHLIKTSKSYANDLNQFLKYYSPRKIYLSDPDLCLAAITDSEKRQDKSPVWSSEDLLKWSRLAQKSWSKLSPASRNRKTACLKGFFSWMYQQHLIEQDISQKLICPKVPRKLPHYLSVDEILSLNKIVSENNYARVLFLLLYGSGLRISEACNLEWKDIDSNKGTLKVLGKGQKQRIVGMPPLTLRAIKNIEQSGKFVFGTSPLDARKAFTLIRNLGAKAGLMKPLNPHALRHSFATHMLASGTDIRIIQEMLGHSSLAATEKYTHLNLASLAQTMEAHHPLGGKK